MNIQQLKQLLDDAIIRGVSQNTPVTLLTGDMTVSDSTDDGIAESIHAELITANYQRDTSPKCNVGFRTGTVLVLVSAGAKIYGEGIQCHDVFFPEM